MTIIQGGACIKKSYFGCNPGLEIERCGQCKRQFQIWSTCTSEGKTLPCIEGYKTSVGIPQCPICKRDMIKEKERRKKIQYLCLEYIQDNISFEDTLIYIIFIKRRGIPKQIL